MLFAKIDYCMFIYLFILFELSMKLSYLLIIIFGIMTVVFKVRTSLVVRTCV